MGLMEIWLNAAVREGLEGKRPVADIATETGLSEAEVLRRGVDLKVISKFAVALSDGVAKGDSTLH